MNTALKSKGIKLTDAIADVITKKMDALDSKVKRFGDAVAASVEVCKTTKHHKKGEDAFHAEILVRLPGKKLISESVDADMYKAFNAAHKEMAQQITAYKEIYEDKKKAKHEKTAKR